MQFMPGQAELAVPAGVALLDQIGTPVLLIRDGPLPGGE